MASKAKWKRVRKLLNDLHLWMGIGAGLILFVVCLTGTIYTFHTEVIEWMDREKYQVTPASSVLTVEQLVDLVEEQTGGQVAAVSIPPDMRDAYQFSVKKEGERRGSTYLVNQYTGAVLGDTKSNTSEFFMVVFRLHRWLMLDTTIGRPIVGWATVVFVLIIVTGLIIWVPQKVKSWKQGLKIKWSGNWKRINHDLHNALGFYTSIFLLIMALTGLQWSFDWYRDGLRGILGVVPRVQAFEEDKVASDDTLGQTELSAAELLSLASQHFPYTGVVRIEFAGKEKPTTAIRKYAIGFFASPAPDELTIDKYSGEVLSKEVFSEKPFNERISRSIKALHVGNVFGTFSKIIYFISCLIATSLPVTGTLIWFNKLKKKSKKQYSVV